MREFPEFLRECAKWAIGLSEKVEKLMRVLFVILLAMGIASPVLVTSYGEWRYWLMLAPFGIIILFMAPYFVWREERRKVKEYETPAIEIVFDKSCKTAIYTREGRKDPLHMVGVRAIGGYAVEMEVFLKGINPDELHTGRVALNPKDSIEGSPSTFTVNPSVTPIRYVEVVEWDSLNKRIGIHYYPNYHVKLRRIPCHLSGRKYTLTLLAVGTANGKRVPECEKTFIAELNEKDEFLFYPVETGSQQMLNENYQTDDD